MGFREPDNRLRSAFDVHHQPAQRQWHPCYTVWLAASLCFHGDKPKLSALKVLLQQVLKLRKHGAEPQGCTYSKKGIFDLKFKNVWMYFWIQQTE